MTDQPNENAILERFHGGLNLNSLDLHKPPAETTLRRLPALSEQPQLQPQPQPETTLRRLPVLSEQPQPEPTLRRLPAANETITNQSETLSRRPEPQTPKPPIADADVPRPHRNKQSAWQELSSKLIEMPSALGSGYFFASRASENLAKSSAIKLKTLSDTAIPDELATSFNINRDHMSAKLKSRLSEATDVVESTLKANPSLYEEGYAFQFKQAHLSEELLGKIHRPGNLEEVISAIDTVPGSGLTTGELGQVSEFFNESLGDSPLFKQERLTELTTDLNKSAQKFKTALAETNPSDFTEMTQSGRAAQAAEKEFYESLLKLRHNVGLSKHAADLDLQAVMRTEPELFVEGRRFEFDPDITPEKVAELKRPDELRELLSKIEKTHNADSPKLITSQGEHLADLKGLSQNAVIKREGLEQLATALETNVDEVVKSRSTAFNLMVEKQAGIMKKSLLTLGAGVGANWAIDRVFFNGQDTGAFTHAANIFAPAILLTDFNPKLKFGVIAGSHLLARISEIPKYKHLERTKLE